jgi:hypothetical protein
VTDPGLPAQATADDAEAPQRTGSQGLAELFADQDFFQAWISAHQAAPPEDETAQ